MITMPVIDMAKTGQNIRNLRDLQRLFGFETPQAIYKWQYGKALPSIDNLVALAAVLQVSIDDILIVQNEMYDCKGA